MKYIVLEMQTAVDGTVASIIYQFDTRNEAEAKYHYILSFAAVTTLPCHSASVLTSNGEMIMSTYYSYTEPEPEPNEPEEPEAE